MQFKNLNICTTHSKTHEKSRKKIRGLAASRRPRRWRPPRIKHLKFRKPASGIYHDAGVRFWRLWRTNQREYGRGHSTVAVRLPSTAKTSHFWQHHGCEGSFSHKSLRQVWVEKHWKQYWKGGRIQCTRKHQFDAQTLLMVLHYLIDGTRGWAEIVGLIKLTGDMEYVACSPDLVLHLDTGAGSFKTVSLEIKCPTTMFSNKFDGRVKIKHLIQIHIQMKRLNRILDTCPIGQRRQVTYTKLSLTWICGYL